MQCSEFDALLTDAIDGVLGRTELARFQAHTGSCPTWGPLLADAEAGRNWLKGLAEVEPPASLVNNILVSTTGVDTQRLRTPARAGQGHASLHASLQVSWLEQMQASLSGFMQPLWAGVRQPRFAMSFGMAFFALSVGLSVGGVKPADLRQVSLRPTAIRHTYYATQARIVHYVDNVRPVLELQAAVHRIRRNAEPAEPGRKETQPVTKPKEDKNDTTQQPEQNRERNYSQTESRFVLASAPVGPSVVVPHNVVPFSDDLINQDLPVVSVTTYRRFV
jgi:Putative zinc-finger